MTTATAAAVTSMAAAIQSHRARPRQPQHSYNSRPRKSSFTSIALLDSNGGGRGGSLNHSVDLDSRVTRREAMLYMPLSLAAALLHLRVLSSAQALEEAPEGFRIYSDDANKYKISIPQEWQVGTGDTKGIKSIVAFYPGEASTSNVSVLITGLGPDFTRLESFGKVDDFAETLVGGLDRSWQKPPGVAAKLIDSKSANGLYYIEYTLKKPGESRRHIYTAMGIGNNGWYNRLFTVTGQFLEEESERYNLIVQKAVRSFRLS